MFIKADNFTELLNVTTERDGQFYCKSKCYICWNNISESRHILLLDWVVASWPFCCLLLCFLHGPYIAFCQPNLLVINPSGILFHQFLSFWYFDNMVNLCVCFPSTVQFVLFILIYSSRSYKHYTWFSLIVFLPGQQRFMWYLKFQSLHTQFILGVFLSNSWLRRWAWWVLFHPHLVSFSYLLARLLFVLKFVLNFKIVSSLFPKVTLSTSSATQFWHFSFDTISFFCILGSQFTVQRREDCMLVSTSGSWKSKELLW